MRHQNSVFHGLIEANSLGGVRSSCGRAWGRSPGAAAVDAGASSWRCCTGSCREPQSLREIVAGPSTAIAPGSIISARRRCRARRWPTPTPCGRTGVFAGLFARHGRARRSRGLRRKIGEAVRLIDSTGLTLSRGRASWAQLLDRRLRRQAARRLRSRRRPAALCGDHAGQGQRHHRRPRPCRSSRAPPTSSISAITTTAGGRSSTPPAAASSRGLRRTRPLAVVAEMAGRAGSQSCPTASAICRSAWPAAARTRSAIPVREIASSSRPARILRIVTNDLDAPAEEIADLYKRRWEIELFFRWIKARRRGVYR